MRQFRNFKSIFFFILITINMPLFSIDTEEELSDTESIEPVLKMDEESLLFRTLAKDIESADYYELLSWCRTLGLDETGGKTDLKNRLLNYFAVVQTPDAEDSSGNVIIIRSANNSEYFTIEEIDEDYLVLQGDVILEFTGNASSEDSAEDNTSNSEVSVTHIVKAQRIVINQTKHILTATGDIEYTLISEDSDQEPEVFYGNTFTFNIETWNGVFIQGGGETNREVEEGEEVSFFYVGDTLTRMDNDIVLMEEGMVTSCEDVDDPHWHIEASKIWVLAPGEWAIADGFFYIGRVPILYIPFFFKAGDEVFFHPSFGYKKEEGVFLQTTTYIFGQKQTDTSSFSFLRATGDENEDYEMETQGIFLRRGDRKETDEENYVFKIALDYYSRLGFFTGLALFPESFADEETTDPNNYFTLNGGFGISRSIFLASSNNYTPYINSEIKSYWNYVSYFGLEIPVRSGLNTKFIFNKSPLTLNGLFEFYSDPFFTEDFYEREEEFNWDRFLNRNIEESISGIYQNVWDFYPEVKSNLQWQLNSSLNFNFSNNYIKSLNINNINFNMNWSSKNDPAMVSGEINQADPSREFYYPTNFIFPYNSKITISGELLHIPFLRTQDADEITQQENEDPGMGFHIPESEEKIPETEEGAQEEDDVEFKGISIKEDEQVQNSISRATTFTLSYSIEPQLLIETHFLHDDWESQDDVDFDIKFSNLTNINLVKLIYNLNVWNSFVVVNGNFNFNSTFKKHFNRGVDTTTWDTYLLSDYENSGLDLNQNFNFYLYPLKYTENFNKSNINYILDWDFLKYKYASGGENGGTPVYNTYSFKWNDQYVNTHKINNSFFFSDDSVNYLKFNSNLPPEMGDYDWLVNYKLNFYSWYLNSYATFGYAEADNELWEFDPLYVAETINIGSWMNFLGTSEWDINYNNWEKAETIIKLFNFDFFGSNYFLTQELLFIPKYQYLKSSKTALNFRALSISFTAERLPPTEIDLNQERWIDDTDAEEQFQPKLLNISLNHTTEPLYLWKNRIMFLTNISTSWALNLYKFTESSFTFNLDFTFNIYKFTDFTFGIQSYNNYSYRYIPAFAEQAGEQWINPIVDIFKSLNIFNKDGRYQSNFKLKMITLALVHHLHDWDLTFEYNGTQTEVYNNGLREWEWQPGFSIILEWKPIPEIKHRIYKEEDTDDIIFRG